MHAKETYGTLKEDGRTTNLTLGRNEVEAWQGGGLSGGGSACDS